MYVLEQIWPRNDDGTFKIPEEFDTLDCINIAEHGLNVEFFEDIGIRWEDIIEKRQ